MSAASLLDSDSIHLPEIDVASLHDSNSLDDELYTQQEPIA
jgi:hypothetical protein